MSEKRNPLTVVALALGWVLVAASTAGAVVALGRNGGGTISAASAFADLPAAAASTSGPGGPGTSGTSGATPSGSAASTTTTSAAPTTTVPKPTSTVTGKVSSGGATHTGDIRFFLLPVPGDASVVGDADGKTLTKADIAADYSNSSDVTKGLQQLGFKDAATRDYQTGDAAYHVEAEVLRFGSQSSASTWSQVDQPGPKWTSFPIPGYSGVKGWTIPPTSPGGLERVRVLYYQGDIVFEIIIAGSGTVDHGVLVDAFTKQLAHLKTGA